MKSPQSDRSPRRDGWARVALSLVFVVASLAVALPGLAGMGWIESIKDDYAFTATPGTCTEITGGTVACNGESDYCDGVSYASLPIGLTDETTIGIMHCWDGQ